MCTHGSSRQAGVVEKRSLFDFIHPFPLLGGTQGDCFSGHAGAIISVGKPIEPAIVISSCV